MDNPWSGKSLTNHPEREKKEEWRLTICKERKKQKQKERGTKVSSER